MFRLRLLAALLPWLASASFAAPPPATFQPTAPLGPLNGAAAVRPAPVTSSIFVRPIGVGSARKVAAPTATPFHRRPVILAPTKAAGSGAASDSKNAAPTPAPVNSNVPSHRRMLGW
jgi:hypothetical protein